MGGVAARSVLAELAASQWGMFTTAQATAAGVTRMQLTRMVASGELERVLHGVYAAPGASLDHRVEIRAAWLAAVPDRMAEERVATRTTSGVVSHASAAGLHGIGNILDHRLELTFPDRHRTRRPELLMRKADLRRDEVMLVDGLPTTTPSRTIADLVVDGHDRDHIAQALADAVRSGSVTLTDVRKALVSQLGIQAAAAVMDELTTAAGLDEASLARRALDSAVARRAFATQFDARLSEFLETVKSNDGAHSHEVRTPVAMPSMDASALVRVLENPAVRETLCALVGERETVTTASAKLVGSRGSAPRDRLRAFS